jgi:hypothetical protein
MDRNGASRMTPSIYLWLSLPPVLKLERVASRHQLIPNTKQRADFSKVTASRCAEDSEHCGNPGNGLLLDATTNAYVPVARGAGATLSD